MEVDRHMKIEMKVKVKAKMDVELEAKLMEYQRRSMIIQPIR